MRDLNGLKVFRDVVSAGGYTAAHRLTGQSRATLSRYINDLEASLGARLIERSTRSFRLTEQGQMLYERSLDILSQLDDAFTMVENQQQEPAGLIRISTPPSLLHFHQLGEEILCYMQAYPRVRIRIEASNRQVDLHNEGVDFVLRARSSMDYQQDDVPVLLARMDVCLVAHPRWQSALKPTLTETLEHVPVIAWKGSGDHAHWNLIAQDKQRVSIRLQPRLVVDDIQTLHQAGLAGLGMIMIPLTYVEDDIAQGRLVRAESDLLPAQSLVHAVHLGHRGMRPAVRHLLDWLKEKTAHLR